MGQDPQNRERSEEVRGWSRRRMDVVGRQPMKDPDETKMEGTRRRRYREKGDDVRTDHG